MNKLFLTITLAFSSLIASAQFSAITTISENTDSAWTITDKLGVGYDVNEKLMVGITMDGEDKYELLARYDLHHGLWATCVYNYESESEEELMDKMEIGVGYSLHLWKGLCFCPNYTLPLKEDEAGEREGKFNLGVTYKF
jgi:predicted porin|tara:strand:- start:330 stop:749 length:420 start_codon:yes stop_codon:yes gene_type:complete